MKVFAKFDEIPSRTIQDIKKTKRHGHTFVRSDAGGIIMLFLSCYRLSY